MTDNMKIWDALKTTDPTKTKLVTFGRKFTSINSQWQLQRMTEQFGPIGLGWTYKVQHSIERITDEYVLAIADVTIYWREDASSVEHACFYGPVRGMSPIVERGKNGLHFDDDAGKKAMTDALTKGLSHLGLSADVFLGLFDDIKYVREAAEQFKQQPVKEPAIEAVDPADRGLVKEGEERSQYEVDKRKKAEAFVAQALAAFETMRGGHEVAEWYRLPISPKGRTTNGDAVDRLSDAFPDLSEKIESAADEIRMRGAALQ